MAATKKTTAVTTSPDGPGMGAGPDDAKTRMLEQLLDAVDELKADNEQLRRRLADAGLSTGTDRPRPRRPKFGLSAGEAHDLAVNGVTVSPFSGEQLLASREGVDMVTAAAVANDARARRAVGLPVVEDQAEE